MRKFLTTITFLGLFFALTLTVSAQTPTPLRTPKGTQVSQDVRQKIAEDRAEKVAALTEMRIEKIRTFFNRMMARFEAAIERLEKLIERIQSRIDKIEEENPDEDTTDEQAQLDEAKDLLDDAKDKMQDLKDDLEDLLTSDDPRAVFKTVGENVKDLKQDLIEIHRILVHIIGDIKGLRVGVGSPKPSPTP